MTEVWDDTTTVTCGCCGLPQPTADVGRLSRHPEIAVCGSCVHGMTGRLANRPSITPIFPVHDMAAARDFWTRAGFRVDEYSPEYAFVVFGDSELAYLDLRAGLDRRPTRQPATCTSPIPTNGTADGKARTCRSATSSSSPGGWPSSA